MNTREKFLIIILGAVVILMGGFKLLIEPKIKSLSGALVNYAEAQGKIQTAENNVLTAKSIDEQNKQLKESIKTGSANFFPELKSDKMQIFFQKLAEETGISYDSFVMTRPVASAISLQTAISEDITYPAKEAADGIEKIEKGDKDNSQESSSSSQAPNATVSDKQLLEMTVVSLQFRGTYEQGVRLLDALKNTKRILRISNVSISTQNDVLVVSISVECYGIKKLTADDELAKDSATTADGKANPFQ